MLLYKITPEIATYEELPESLKGMASRYYWEPIPPHVESPVLRITEAEPGKVGRGLYIALVAAVYGVIGALCVVFWRFTR